VPREFYFDGLHPEVESAVRAAIETLASLGAEVREISLPLVDEANAAWHVLALAEAYTVHQRDVEQSWEVLGPDVRLRLLTGLDFSVADLVRARWMQAETKKKMVETMNEVDVIAVPATPIPAVGIASGTVTVGEEEVHGTQALGRLTRLAPFTGQPAISVPCGFTTEGLPVGLQLIGRWFEEPALLQMAHAFERATEWRRRRPPEESWTT